MATKEMEALEETVEKRTLLVKFSQPPPKVHVEEKVRDKLQIYFQKRRHGGGDVEKVLYPVPGHPENAVIVFSKQSYADMQRLISSPHQVDLGKDVKIDVVAEPLPQMFQEVHLVVDQFYWPLLPRIDDLKDDLLATVNATFDQETDVPFFKIQNSKYIEQVRDMFAEMIILKTDKESMKHKRDEREKEIDHKGMHVGTTVDQGRPQKAAHKPFHPSVRPKEHSVLNGEHKFHADQSRKDPSDLHKRSTESAQRSPSLMAANFSNQSGSTLEDNTAQASMDHGVTSDQAFENHFHKAEAILSKSVMSHRGPFSVATLLYKYLETIHKEDMKEIRRKFRVEIECTPDKMGVQGEVKIKGEEGHLDQAENDFISLYQKCFQNVIIKQMTCEGVGSWKINKAASYIQTKQPSVLFEDSIDEEVTFVGEEKEVVEAIREFQRITGLQPKSRKLRHTTVGSSSPMPSPSLKQGSSALVEHRLQTDEGIEVVAKKDDITRQSVDVIVNPSNGELTLSDGVGGALLSVAGQQLQADCETARRRNGISFAETQCVVTKGYKLQALHVVHAISPAYSSGCEDEFYRQLNLTFLNCLTKANELKAQSIALPLISSGMCGGPKEVCSKALIDAVKNYSKMESSKTIKLVCLVNKDDSACDAIVKLMTWLTTKDNDDLMDTSSESETGRGKSAFWTETVPAEHSSNMNSTEEMSRPLDVDLQKPVPSDDSGMEQCKSYTIGKIQLIVKRQHILESIDEINGIIVPVDNMLNSVGDDTSTVISAAGINTESFLQKKTFGHGFRDGEIIHTDGNDLSNVAIVFVVIPTQKKFQSDGEFFDKITELVHNSLKYADANLHLRSIALPLFPPDICRNKLCSEEFVKAVRRFTVSGDPKSIRQIHIKSDTDQSNMALQYSFGDEFKDADDVLARSSGTYASSGGNADGARANSADGYSDINKMGRNWLNKGSETGHTPDKGDSENDEGKVNESDEDDKRCPICLEDFSDETLAVNQGKCKHKFCKECLDKAMQHKPVCPVCGIVYGVMKGNQPRGHMSVRESSYGNLPGYEGCGIITINYIFSSGTQGPNHPEPGKSYSGTQRTAYLPNNTEGKKVLGLLKRAFDARLTFTIGTSVTTGANNVVTWNDIHHKTSQFGGPQCFGYPDPTYLRRVTEELAAKGIK